LTLHEVVDAVEYMIKRNQKSIGTDEGKTQHREILLCVFSSVSGFPTNFWGVGEYLNRTCLYVLGICFNVLLVEEVLKCSGFILNMSKVITYRVYRCSMFFGSMTISSEKLVSCLLSQKYWYLYSGGGRNYELITITWRSVSALIWTGIGTHQHNLEVTHDHRFCEF
jgi:hypothetical protein